LFSCEYFNAISKIYYLLLRDQFLSLTYLKLLMFLSLKFPILKNYRNGFVS